MNSTRTGSNTQLHLKAILPEIKPAEVTKPEAASPEFKGCIMATTSVKHISNKCIHRRVHFIDCVITGLGVSMD